MLKTRLCDYSNRYILFKETILVAPVPPLAANPNSIYTNVPFTDSMNGISNTRIDNAKDIDVVIPAYKLIEYSGIYSKTFGILW